MEGGAMRGMFTAGVCDVLLENGINFDGAIGVSAGATFGCNFKSKQIGRATDPWNIGLFFRNYDDFYYENWNINWGLNFYADRKSVV